MYVKPAYQYISFILSKALIPYLLSTSVLERGMFQFPRGVNECGTCTKTVPEHVLDTIPSLLCTPLEGGRLRTGGPTVRQHPLSEYSAVWCREHLSRLSPVTRSYGHLLQ